MAPRTPACRRTRPALELARRLRNDFLHVAGLALPGAAPFGHQRRALDRGEMIEEQYAVEVVDLVLNGPGLVAGDLQGIRLAVAIERLERDVHRAIDFGEDVGDGEAPF